MKLVMLLIVAGVIGYFGYQRVQDRNPPEITDPVFAEIRMDYDVAGRNLNLVLFGKMSDEQDCRLRAATVWEDMIEGCQECSMKVTDCRADLAPRYARLFEDQTIQSTYLSFTRGSRYERDGRMVIYGLTSDEGDALCDMAKTEFQKNYSGQVQCVRGRRE